MSVFLTEVVDVGCGALKIRNRGDGARDEREATAVT